MVKKNINSFSPVHMLREDREAYGSFEDRVEAYSVKSARHRERLPFLFIEKWQGNVPEKTPDWIQNSEDIQKYWNIATCLANLYAPRLERIYSSRRGEGTETQTDVRKQEDETFADEELVHLGEQEWKQDGYQFFKKWTSQMHTFLRHLEMHRST